MLPILQGDPSERLGVCAMGEVAPDEELTWMRVWVWQHDKKKPVAATGTSGEHLGGHRVAPSERLPFTKKKGWMIQTQLEPGSEQFSAGKPALAMAMAIVKHSDGSTEVDQWSQAVTVGKRPGKRAGGRPRP